MNENKKNIHLFSLLRILILIAAVLFTFVFAKSCKTEEKEPTLDFSWIQELLNMDPIMGYKDEEVVSILIGENREVNELKVMEQDLEDVHEVTDAFLNLEIFRKTQRIHYYGTANYIVDLSKISEEDIIINKDDKSITIVIPHSEMDGIVMDYEKTTLEEVDRELLGWGDIHMNMEQFVVLQQDMQSSLESAAKDKKLYEEADNKAKKAVLDIYKKALNELNPDYSINVVFDAPMSSEK